MRQRFGGWLLPLTGVIFYPSIITTFTGMAAGYRELGDASLAGGAALLMLMAGSIPVIAARALIRIRQDEMTNPVLTRSLLYLMFSVSPVYVLSILVAAKAGMVGHHGVIWVSTWMLAGLTLFLRRSANASNTSATQAHWLRIVHGAAALCLLLGFLIAHLINHDLAIWSVQLHGSTMEWLRLWYRCGWAEPVLFALLMVMIATGAPLVAQHSRRSTDAYRVVQMATGVYIAAFLCAHLLAVLGARSAGVETDWFFATGPNGLLDGRGMLIPYYIFGVLFVMLHVGCGLRIVLLKHGIAAAVANKAFYGVAAAGFIVTALAAIAALGWNFSKNLIFEQ
jgi:succinate dehydrogenase/fumarate reductase cytochrome b subunit